MEHVSLTRSARGSRARAMGPRFLPFPGPGVWVLPSLLRGQAGVPICMTCLRTASHSPTARHRLSPTLGRHGLCCRFEVPPDRQTDRRTDRQTDRETEPAIPRVTPAPPVSRQGKLPLREPHLPVRAQGKHNTDPPLGRQPTSLRNTEVTPPGPLPLPSPHQGNLTTALLFMQLNAIQRRLPVQAQGKQFSPTEAGSLAAW